MKNSKIRSIKHRTWVHEEPVSYFLLRYAKYRHINKKQPLKIHTAPVKLASKSNIYSNDITKLLRLFPYLKAFSFTLVLFDLQLALDSPFSLGKNTSAIRSIAQSLSKSKKIEILSIRIDVQRGACLYTPLAWALRKLPRLNSLSLCVPELCFGQLSLSIAKFSQSMKSLRILENPNVQVSYCFGIRSLKTLANLLNRMKSLSYLSLSIKLHQKVSSAWEYFFSKLGNLTKLRHLHLDIPIAFNYQSNLSAFIGRNPKLQTLSIKEYIFTNTFLEFLSKEAPNLQTLNSLALLYDDEMECHKMSPQESIYLQKIISCQSQLKNLSIELPKLAKKTSPELYGKLAKGIEALKESLNTLALKITGDELNTYSILEPIQAITQITVLYSLELIISSTVEFDIEFLPKVYQSLGKMKKIRFLTCELNDCTGTYSDVYNNFRLSFSFPIIIEELNLLCYRALSIEELSVSLICCLKLRKLKLKFQENPVNDASSFSGLRPILQQLNSLCLDFSGRSYVKDQEAISWFKSIKFAKNLQEFSVNFYRKKFVSKKVPQSLQDLLQSLPKLTSLFVGFGPKYFDLISTYNELLSTVTQLKLLRSLKLYLYDVSEQVFVKTDSELSKNQRLNYQIMTF